MTKKFGKSIVYVIKVLLKISKCNLQTKQTKEKPSVFDFFDVKQYWKKKTLRILLNYFQNQSTN